MIVRREWTHPWSPTSPQQDLFCTVCSRPITMNELMSDKIVVGDFNMRWYHASCTV